MNFTNEKYVCLWNITDTKILSLKTWEHNHNLIKENA